jgi:S1-C subfamily serine protease
VKLATIQIVSKGNFVPFGETDGRSSAGSGSGFIIDPSGIAVTNNHVVTGAALIEVYVGGEDKPRNARVLGVAECSDLAVIDIEGDGFDYLEWFDGEILAGTSVFAAGFPLGDPEYTITRGVVSKERANGESTWASVERVIEHDATIRPGNSGGPLVTDDGRVLGVNYAGKEGGPYYAIGRDEALALIEPLRASENVTSIGLNGRAIRGEDISGIWVSSVESGSPLSNAGIKPGDFLTRLEGLELAMNGSMSDYCQILRSRNASDVMSIQVYRPGTGELLEGEVNGKPIEPVGQAAPSATAAPAGDTNQTVSQVVAIGPGEVDVAQARAGADAARGQYRELDFETFDRAGITRHSWQEDGDSILRNAYYRLIVREANALRTSYWRPRGEEQRLGSSYFAELDVAFDTQGATGGVGIAFDGQDTVNGLTFIIRSDNTWQVVGFQNGSYAQEYSSEPVATTAIVDGVNRLRVWRTPDGTSFWINNTPVGTLRSTPFGGGLVGVAAYGGANVSTPISVIADNFRVLQAR